MIISTIRFNMALPGQDPEQNAARHQAVLDIAEPADAAGLGTISLEEHHGVTFRGRVHGWSASPITLATGILARTRQVTVALWGIALPLHDPLRLAEDVATMDLLAPGRVVLTVNTGYRELEFAAHDQTFADRVEVFDAKLVLLRAAWTGAPITKDGHDIVVTPRPATQPHPMLLVGGASADDAVLAARHDLPFRPSADVPELRSAYEEACAATGSTPLYLAPPPDVSLVQIAHDPDRWWDLVGEHLLLEARLYASWMRPGEFSAVHSTATTVEELRAEGTYRILTPAAAVARPARKSRSCSTRWPAARRSTWPSRSAELFTGVVLPELAPGSE